MTTHDTFPPSRADLTALQAIVDHTGLFPSEYLPEMMEPFWNNADGHLWIAARSGDRLAGFAFATPEDHADRTWNMRALAVHPDHQRSGVARCIVQDLETALRKSDQRLLIVDTSGTDAFTIARAFYAACGYQEEARIRDFWAKGDDKITFRKAL
ncbi:GNAT family N-acetyltransferase [Marivita sp. S6314]|uniref:GNAT family N-acetyltransferase n=1 Tax=Marivita sp. S6314 TaxID=2926406 RepID=UPI001FF60982|nr:GNAT family N-acetyltransferase [Marivita sp. S6314]MCK0148724.1 GNAT family N-acetyltransferase [Marivita sp. S6314]